MLCASPVCAGLLLATNVWAADDYTITAGTLSGELNYKTLTINGKLEVANYDSSTPGTGWLWIKAHEIIINDGGSIQASGSGYPGSEAGGSGYLGGEGGTPTMVDDVASPGGGGAHFGAGGPGNDGLCQPFLGAQGGLAYDTDSANPLALVVPEFGMGSAGGTGNSGAPNNWKGVGGKGGGVVILDAALITLNGPITADGEVAATTLAASPGGGAGGTILIRSALLQTGAGGLLSARGGLGAVGNTYGGSGAGGLIIVSSAPAAQPLVDGADTSGGPGNGICSVNSTAGQPGLAILDSSQGCNDADGDGYPSVACGGDDCDDGDDEININRVELCDDTDNDCDGENNEDPETICPTGQFCSVDGVCVANEVDGGTGDGGATAGPEVELHGGLCAIVRPLGSSPGTVAESASRVGPVALLLTVLGLVGLRRRRSRR